MPVEVSGAQTPRIGEVLRTTREARGLTLEDVSNSLLVREDYLQAIENMYANGVPKGYLTGILRTYAGFLDLPAEETVESFKEQCGAVSEAADTGPSISAKVEPQKRMRGQLIAAALGFMIIGAGAAAVFLPSQTETDKAVITEAGTPVNGARESLFAVASDDELAAQLPLTLTAVSAGWLEVRGADGTIFRSRKMAAGEVYHPRIGAGWTVTARNGGAFVWHVGDAEIGPLGEGTSPVFAISVDAVASKAQDIAAPSLAAVGESQPSR